jgi:hypothetical protein
MGTCAWRPLGCQHVLQRCRMGSSAGAAMGKKLRTVGCPDMRLCVQGESSRFSFPAPVEFRIAGWENRFELVRLSFTYALLLRMVTWRFSSGHEPTVLPGMPRQPATPPWEDIYQYCSGCGQTVRTCSFLATRGKRDATAKCPASRRSYLLTYFDRRPLGCVGCC